MKRSYKKAILMFAVPLLVGLGPSLATAQQDPKAALRSLDIEDLMKVEVTTASKSSQALADVPAAIYVISHEDIRRSGAINVPEALRLAPGVMVSQISASEWMISIRGFNTLFADKLLVLVDGRSVYTPLKSGVYWDSQSYPLEDIDRIEVIRGPGSSLWGANAVNGIVNVITKKASFTQGSSVSTEIGSDFVTSTSYRFGANISADAFYRVYAMYLKRNGLDNSDGTRGPDSWAPLKAGFRVDSGKETVISSLSSVMCKANTWPKEPPMHLAYCHRRPRKLMPSPVGSATRLADVPKTFRSPSTTHRVFRESRPRSTRNGTR